MSGGFFRGTSADQDTRFSNKQAKLLKSQKFAPELENLVDITKVKMDVMRPWIANRVTELLGFEDEVLINFIYGLLDGKIINGKEIQISLTGFMEKNTGRFMKELWTLLLSAEKNASGVPQQFLDAKEEETRNKKAETDRITNEIQRRKEKEDRELELEKLDKMEGKVDNSARANDGASDRSLRHQPKDSSTRTAVDGKEMNGSRGRTRVSRSPHSVDRSPSPARGPSRSNSKSFSNSRSRSDERCKSRSRSGSPHNQGGSVSSERMRRSIRRRSGTPRRRDSPNRSFSPSRRHISQYRQRSISPSRRRSPSPIGRRLRSPMRRRSRSPMRRRSRTPIRRRSRTPIRRRSRTPLRRRRSPIRRRSRTPLRYRSVSRSPVRYRSRSPGRYGSRSPLRRRTPSSVRRRSPSPLRRRFRRSPSSPRRSLSPSQRRAAIPSRRRSPTPPKRLLSSSQELSSQSPIRQASPSPVRRISPKRQKSPLHSPKGRIRTVEQFSPARPPPPSENIECAIESRKGRSPQRDAGDRYSSRRRLPSLSPSPNESPSGSEIRPASRGKGLSEDKRSISPYQSPVEQKREPIIQHGRPSPRKLIEHKNIPDSSQGKKTKVSREVEDPKNKSSGKKQQTHSSSSDELVSVPKGHHNVKGSDQQESEALTKISRKIEERDNRRDSDSEAGAKNKSEVYEKRKHKRSKRQESDDDSYDSELGGRREAKRRKKEEKKLRKEERRRRRQERRHRKEERRAEKLKQKSGGIVSAPSGFEEKNDGNTSDDEHVARRKAHSSDNEEAESEQKKLEIALREKALESLRAKKGTGH